MTSVSSENVIAANRNNVSNAKKTINSNEFVDESGIAVFKDVDEKRTIDKDYGKNCKRSIYFVCQ